MSIEKIHGMFCLTCDICDDEADSMFESFQDAIDYMENCGWVKKLKSDGWKNICPNCVSLEE